MGMKFAKLILASAAALLLAACGTGGGTLDLKVDNNTTSTPPAQGKVLFSLWMETGNLYQIDLRNSQFGVTSNVTLTTFTGQNCICQMLIQGTDAAGQATLSNCAGSYSNCAQFNSTGGSATYTNNGTTLQICAAVNSCDTFN